MKYILNPHVALRSWRLVPNAYYIRGDGVARGLSAEEFEVLKGCDGTADIAPSPALDKLLALGLCFPAKGTESLSDWQRFRSCDNRYFPSVNWAITGKCNFNCRHCFNAADNARSMGEFSWDQCLHFIKELDSCGVQNVALTGGEPMMHPHFMDICREIDRRGMVIEELTTNGSFITQEMLEEFAGFSEKPIFKLSFDGLGHHDWFRDKPGSEQEALSKMQMLLEGGFRVRSQTNVHVGNKDTMLPTAQLLSSMGLESMRIIRTTEAPRWLESGGDLCLSPKEYYDFAVDFMRAYLQLDLDMSVEVWQTFQIFPKNRTYRHRPIEGGEHTYRDSLPVCQGNRGLIAITYDGDILPCNQMSGYFKKHGVQMGNVHETPLRELLNEGAYLDAVCLTVGELKEENPQCKECPYWKLCLGGCRALGILFGGGYTKYDPLKCLYFNEYLKTFEELFDESWRSLDDFSPENYLK